MADFCTCGAQLVPDALFCHKCGRPVRELTAPAADNPPPVPLPPPAAVPDLHAIAQPAPGVVNFQNRVAVRTALMMAGLSSLAGSLPLGPLISGFWWLVVMTAAGFVAVYVYHKRTGEVLSVRNGMRMGWMTGLFNFLIALILLTAGAVAVSGEGGLSARFKEQIQQNGNATPEMQEALKILDAPAGFAMMLFTVLFFVFFLTTLLPMLGGALGAKVIEPDR